MDYMYLLLLHSKETDSYSVMVFADAISAHISANWYNIYTQLHAEVFMIPVIESVIVQSDKRNIMYKYFKDKEENNART